MFENYVVAKTQKRAKWKTVFITISVSIHAVAIVALLIRGFWVISKLPPPSREVTLTLAPPPPPPPPPPPASKKRQKPKPDVVRKVKVKDTVQPQKKDPNEPEVEMELIDEDEGMEGGVEGGVAGGTLGGVFGGQLGGVPGGVIKKAAPPPPPPKPRVVPQKAVEAQRIAGEKHILPDDAVKLQISRDGRTRIVATVKMCLSKTGNVQNLNMIKTSGYPAYDRKIKNKMRAWKYQPFVVNGNPVPVCTSVTFIYSQR